MIHVFFNEKKILYEIAVNSDEKAFKSFFNYYYAKLLDIAFHVLRNNDIAKDVVLEVFEKVWEQRVGLTTINDLNKYLLVLTKNKSIDQLRKRKDLITFDEVATDISETIVLSHPENIFLDKELLEKINDAVLNLPEKCRLVYRLVKEEGLKYKEVSELLNLSYKTVDNHINNAMSSIRQEINAYNGVCKPSNPIWRVMRVMLLVWPF